MRDGAPEARLEWHGTSLHPLRDSDLTWLRQAELSSYLAFRWRHRGEHIPPSEFGPSLWSATFVNFVVAGAHRPGEPVGIVSAYELDSAGAHCKVAVAAFSPRTRMTTFRGLLLTLDYLFMGWPLQKIYFDLPAFNVHQLAGKAREHLSEEGVLRDHIYLDGGYHDLHIWALYRQAWLRWRAQVAGWSC